MKLRSFVPFTALEPGGAARRSPRWRSRCARWPRSWWRCARRRSPRRARAPCCSRGWPRPQLVKHPARRSAGRHAAAQDRLGRQRRAAASRARWPSKLGRRSPRRSLIAVDDPLLAGRAGQGAALRRLPDRRRGRSGAARLADRERRAEVAADVAHAAQGDRALERPRARAALRRRRARTSARCRDRRRARPSRAGAARGARPRSPRAGGVTTYVVRLLDDGSLPGGEADDLSALLSFGGGGARAAARQAAGGLPASTHGKETLVRGLTLENLLPRSLKDITAVGQRPHRLQLHGRRRRVLGHSLDDHRAAAAVLRRRRAAADRQATASRRVYPSPLAAAAQPYAPSSVRRPRAAIR